MKKIFLATLTILSFTLIACAGLSEEQKKVKQTCVEIGSNSQANKTELQGIYTSASYGHENWPKAKDSTIDAICDKLVRNMDLVRLKERLNSISSNQ